MQGGSLGRGSKAPEGKTESGSHSVVPSKVYTKGTPTQYIYQLSSSMKNSGNEYPKISL